MKLSITSGAVYGVRADGRLQFLPELGIAQCAQAGFERMEYNLLAGPTDDRPLARASWREDMVHLRQVMDENGVAVPYTHDYWYLLSQTKDAEEEARKETLVRRSVEATHILGGRLMVVHTQSVYDSEGYNADKTWDYNRAFFDELGELAGRYGILLAVENLFPVSGAIEFSSYAEDLAALMQALNDPMFGICWDFGHANMAKVDHEKSLETVAPWLRLIHVDDNKATADEHNIPGYGTVPWDTIMPKLKAIGYEGDMNLSVRTFAHTTLPEQRVEALKLLHSIGSELIQMYNEA